MPDTVLVKPAGADCDLACGYCFYRPPDAPHRCDDAAESMPDDVLEALVRQMLAGAPRRVAFIWQGGEPTLLGPEFFERVVELQQRTGRGHTVGNALQTNGQRIDARWTSLLQRYRFLVGLSVDGPREIHDAHRRGAQGAGSWDRAAEAARRLLEAGVAVNALSVVTARSVEEPDAVYDALRGLGFQHLQFLPCVEPADAPPASAGSAAPAPFSVDGEAYGRFLCRVFDRWWDDTQRRGFPVSVRLFDSLLHRWSGRPSPECALAEECADVLVVERDGGVYPCDFYVRPEWRLGDVRRDELAVLARSERMVEFRARKRALAAPCQRCPWRPLCNGGCPKDRLGPRTHLCEGHKLLFRHSATRLRTLAKRR